MANIKQFVTINPGTLPDDNGLSFALKASTDYGGLTVTKVSAVTGAVGTFNLALVNYGTAGTVAAGTIATMASGTATVWAADTPQALTVAAAQAFLDEGEWAVLKKTESAANNDLSADAVVIIEYLPGVVSQG